eukprot:TRINITY_DN54532_c0_g1_i1.p1 TRINITY_DN54532_c0_g1~~TRINITY_DN54532_c0_g1_i1.p1  ORF type:complete len:163 (-),score=23.34 TRINITY_DN54532_c0_g1_i1:452-940(-)
MDWESPCEKYELCVQNTFIVARFSEIQCPRRNSAPAVMATHSIAPTPYFHGKHAGARTCDATPTCDASSEAAATVVKMFIGNVPFHVTAERMEIELCALGFKGTYMSLNFPLKSPEMTRGYGFVLFFEECHAIRFASTFKDYRFKDTTSKKRCYVKRAKGNV